MYDFQISQFSGSALYIFRKVLLLSNIRPRTENLINLLSSLLLIKNEVEDQTRVLTPLKVYWFIHVNLRLASHCGKKKCLLVVPLVWFKNLFACSLTTQEPDVSNQCRLPSELCDAVDSFFKRKSSLILIRSINASALINGSF